MSMSPADAIEAAIAAGYAQAAAVIGHPHQVFRPTGPTEPMMTANLRATLPVAWKPASLGDKFRGSVGFTKFAWHGYYDLTRVQPGDYLVRQSDGAIWFVAAQQPLLQPLGIECNAVLTVTRPGSAADQGVGAVGYGDEMAPAPVLSGWPASLLAGPKGERGEDGLPRDTRQPWYVVLLPRSIGTRILTADRVVDQNGDAYVVSSVQEEARGWKLTVAYAGT